MKRFGIGIFVLMIFSVTAYSQDLILKNGDTVVNNDSIYLTGTKSTELIELRLSVTNNRATAVALKVKKTEIKVVDGAECSFCWGECYTPAVFVSPMAINILPGATDRNSFVGDYRPWEMEGTSEVKFTFYNPADTTYQQSVTVFFQIGGSGITDPVITDAAVTVGPNPVSDNIKVNLPAGMPGSGQISLLNPDGRLVKQVRVPAGETRITLPAGNLPAGIYYIRITGEKGFLSTRKVLISR